MEMLHEEIFHMISHHLLKQPLCWQNDSISGWFKTFISQSDRTDLQGQIETDSREYDIFEDDLHGFVLF